MWNWHKKLTAVKTGFLLFFLMAETDVSKNRQRKNNFVFVYGYKGCDMSRSYKHTPYCGDKKTKWAKRQANKLVRSKLERWNMQDEISPAWYKKISDSWNICDYYNITTWKEHLRHRRKYHGYIPYGMKFLENGEIDIENEWNLFQKWYKRK